MLEDATRAAILAIRQGGEWHFHSLAVYASLKLKSKVQCLFDGTDRNNIVTLQQPRGAVYDGLVLYKREVARVYRYIDVARLDRHRIICDALTTSAVLAEIWCRFERAGTVLISNTLSAALASCDPLKAQELCQDIRANAVLILLSTMNRRRPDLFPNFIKATVSPLVVFLYRRFQARLDWRRPPILPCMGVSLGPRPSLHFPADSRPSVPDGVTCATPLPRHLSSSPPSSSSDNAGPCRSDIAFGPTEATTSKRKQPATDEQQEQDAENRRKRHHAEAGPSSRLDEKGNLPSIPAHATSRLLMRRTPYPSATAITYTVAQDVSGVLNRPQTEEQQKTKREAALRQRRTGALRKAEEKENIF